ncbi:MAG: hypothetical protein IJV06_12580 [Bacteroidaceae bacterium]|nr:hypothetical protein [Bacteroidaceae bacterium]MBQ9642366.1 hypothetical protein [Bacteroidaceae bacterium]
MEVRKILFILFAGCCACAVAQPDYQMAGPYEVVARDGVFRASKAGSERDMQAAYDLATQGYDEKALEIINAYATTLQRLDGHDAPLCAIQGFKLVQAMTLKRERQQPASGVLAFGLAFCGMTMP